MTTTFVFPGMFHAHIKESKLKMPENFDFDQYDPEEYPHFHLFLLSHIGFPINPSVLKDNANIIADITVDKVKTITFKELIDLGVEYCFNQPLD